MNHDRQDDNSNGKCGVCGHAQLDETDRERLRQRKTTGNENIAVGPELAISGSRSLSKSFGYTFIEILVIENPEFVVGISMLSVIVSEI